MTTPAPPDAAGRIIGRAGLFGTALMATVVVTVLPLPWRLSGLGFGLVALVAGVRLLVELIRRRRAGRPTTGWLGVTAGIGLASFLLMILAAELLLYPLLAERERCSERAITHLDAVQCDTTFEQHWRRTFDGGWLG